MAYMVFKEFYSYRRAAGTNINNFFVCYEFFLSEITKIWNHLVGRSSGLFFFVRNAANISEKNEKLLRTMCGSLTYIAMKDMLKCFANISSSKYNTVLAIKEKMEMVNFK